MCSHPGSWDADLQQLADKGTIDVHGMRVSSDRLECILAAARRYGDGKPLLRDANFRMATFEGAAHFDEATFEGAAHFDEATFKGETHFDVATFGRRANFRKATFRGVVHFRQAVFSGKVHFEQATFEREAHFPEATFERTARFQDAVFKGFAHFPDVTFGMHAVFRGADLKEGFRLGPAVVAGRLVLDEASLGNVDMRVSTRLLCCLRTRFHDPAHLKVRWADIHLDEAVFDRASTLALSPSWSEVREMELPPPCNGIQPGSAEVMAKEEAGASPAMPRLASLRGADVASLTLADINLKFCDFKSALRLDQLRLATLCPFDEPPEGWRWTKRIMIREERYWRLTGPKPADWRDEHVKRNAEEASTDGVETNEARRRSEALRLAKIYRALRKGREDEGNAPGAGDFYYGEMEMRRHGEESGPERAIISLYWLVSGYGLRASRALIALVVTVLLFTCLFSIAGIRDGNFWDDLVFSLQSTTNLLRGPAEDIPIEGELLEIGLRLLGPLFFGLALLSLRGRVKR